MTYIFLHTISNAYDKQLIASKHQILLSSSLVFSLFLQVNENFINNFTHMLSKVQSLISKLWFRFLDQITPKTNDTVWRILGISKDIFYLQKILFATINYYMLRLEPTRHSNSLEKWVGRRVQPTKLVCRYFLCLYFCGFVRMKKKISAYSIVKRKWPPVDRWQIT